MQEVLDYQYKGVHEINFDGWLMNVSYISLRF